MYSDYVTLRYSLEHSSWAGIVQPRNSLRPGRSGYPIPVAAGFSARFQTAPGPTQPLAQFVTDVFPGDKATGAWC